MKKTLLVSVASACLVCAFALPALHAVDAPADGAKLDYIAGGEKNLVVVFNHSTHKTAKCEACHHVEGEKAYAKCGSAGCHDVFDKADKTEKSWYKVVHDAKGGKHATCISCHKEAAGEDKEKKAKLTGCKNSACHPG